MVHHHHHDRGEQQHAEDGRVVAPQHRLEGEPAEARPVEDRLDQDRAGQHVAELQAEHRDHRQQRVAQRVLVEHDAVGQALGARGADEVRAQHVEHRRARQPAVLREVHERSASPSAAPGGAARRARRAARRRSSRCERMPATGRIGSTDANRITSMMPIQNTGAAKPTSDSTVMNCDSKPFGLRDDSTPSVGADDEGAEHRARRTSSSVAGTRSAIMLLDRQVEEVRVAQVALHAPCRGRRRAAPAATCRARTACAAAPSARRDMPPLAPAMVSTGSPGAACTSTKLSTTTASTRARPWSRREAA